MKILVAEDDAQMRLVLKHILTRSGHDVIEASDGAAALEQVAKTPVDLAIIDIVMPHKEGVEVILEIRKTRRHLRIIAMSGGARFHAKDPLLLAQECGANFVIAKPFQPQDLLQLVQLCHTADTNKSTSL